MEEKEVRQRCIGIMEKAGDVFLTTIGKDGFPYIRCIFNLRNKEKFPDLAGLYSGGTDDFLVYLSTNTSSVKVSQLKENSAVSVYYCIPEKFHSLMLAGNVEILDDLEIKKAIYRDGWEIYFPTGPGDPDFTLLRLQPLFARGWYENFAFEFKLR